MITGSNLNKCRRLRCSARGHRSRGQQGQLEAHQAYWPSTTFVPLGQYMSRSYGICNRSFFTYVLLESSGALKYPQNLSGSVYYTSTARGAYFCVVEL